MLHARSAQRDCQRLREVHGVDTIVLLNEDHEIARFVNDVPPPAGPQNLMAALAENSIALLRLPIPDGGVPRPNQEDELRALLTDVVALLRAGKNVAVACRGGIGRNGWARVETVIGGKKISSISFRKKGRKFFGVHRSEWAMPAQP